MSNEEFLNQIQHMYDSAQYLNLENNLLTLNYNGTNTITLTNVSLTNLNPNLFLLQPDEIFDTLHILDILPKQEINDYESTFINNYVNKYLELNDKALEHSKDIEANEDLEELNTKLNGLKTPIYLAYDPQYENTAASILIQELMNNHIQEIEHGRGNQVKKGTARVYNIFAFLTKNPEVTFFHLWILLLL